MPYSDPREPRGRALRDYFRGDAEATLIVHSDLAAHDELPAGVFFRSPRISSPSSGWPWNCVGGGISMPAPARELYADSETLAEHAEVAGWRCDIVFRDGHGSYVARLTRP